MRYLPKSPDERAEMLRAIGVDTVGELFSGIPAEARLDRPLRLDAGKSEAEVLGYFRARAAECAREFTSFLGAGAYDHFRPAVVDALISRSEFSTAYTPYQPEISQGTLQSIFEFQTLICQLTGMDVANASLYDGSTALPEAVMMAVRTTGRHRALVARSVHPEYRQVLDTYIRHQGMHIDEIPCLATGQVDSAALTDRLGDDVAAVVLQSPNFFGIVEEPHAIAAEVHAAGALLVAMVSEPVSLGVVRPPSEADIVAGEAQGCGVPPSFGGPYVGFLSTRDQYKRAIPGRLVGQTTDSNGERAFCLTLTTREQHIRREKATSNICTNQALCALMVTIFLSLYGRQGFRDLALHNLAKAGYAASALRARGATLRFAGPFFNEFVVSGIRPPADLEARLAEARIIGGLDLARYYPELAGDVLFCFTENASREAIDRMVEIYTG